MTIGKRTKSEWEQLAHSVYGVCGGWASEAHYGLVLRACEKDENRNTIDKDAAVYVAGCVRKWIETCAPTEVEVMNPVDVRSLGVLQEANRQFFHPHGMALTMIRPKDPIPGEEDLPIPVGIRGVAVHKDGIHFGHANDADHAEERRRRAECVAGMKRADVESIETVTALEQPE